MIRIDGKVYQVNDEIDFKLDITENREKNVYLYKKDVTFKLSGKNAQVFLLCSFNKVYELSVEKSIYIKRFIKNNIVKEAMSVDNIYLCRNKFTNLIKFNNEYYIFNLLYKTIDIIPEHLYKHLKNDNFDNINDNILNYMISRRYIEPTNFNNKEKIYIKDTECITVYMVFSYICNLKCVYCFENKVNQIQEMSNEVFNESIKMLKNISKDKKVILVLYGGEPLLSNNYVRIKEVVEIFKENQNIFFRIITNGVNAKEFIPIFKEIRDRVIEFVITLDGLKRIHNERRMFKDGRETFDIICTSIYEILKFNIRVKIRINIDYNNIYSQDELVAFLEDKFGFKNIILEYNLVEQNNKNDYENPGLLNLYKVCSNLIKNSKLEIQINYPIWYYISNFHTNRNKKPILLNSPCMIGNGFVIDNDGKLYHCNEGMKEKKF